jgi:hypothetical protein
MDFLRRLSNGEKPRPNTEITGGTWRKPENVFRFHSRSNNSLFYLCVLCGETILFADRWKPRVARAKFTAVNG